MLDIDTYIEIMEEAIKLGKERGKKEGDNIEQEFFEIAAKLGKMEKIQHLGQTEKDIDLLSGNLRENGLKVFNIKEIERRNNNEKAL
jgi:hypothetical protein